MIPHVNDSKNEKELEEIDLSQLYQYEKQKHLNWYDQVLLSKPLKVVIALLLVAVLAPLLFYHFMFFSSLEQAPSDGFSDGTCVIPRASRLPCGSFNVPQAECHPQCCYDLNNHLCFHRHPSRFSYIMDREWTEELILQPRIATVPFAFQNSLPNIRLMIDEISATHMSLQFYNSREMSLTGNRLDEKNYDYHVSPREMGITIGASQGVIFSTIKGPLIASKDIWELAFKLTNETMFGLGELPLRAGTVKVIYNHRGGLSSIPLIFAKVNSSYHGVLIESEAPTEVHVLEDNQIVIRIITSSGLKLHVFAGPQPSDVMSDAMKLIGADAQLEYWMLGAHICSESSQTIPEAYDDLTTFLNTAIDAGLPFESHCGTAPVVFDSDCDPETVKYHEDGASAVKAATKRYVPHVSPHIRYRMENETASEEVGMNKATIDTCKVDVDSKYKEYMLRSSQSNIYVGSIQNVTFVYPIFENSSHEFMKSLWAYDVEIDGIVIENSWPLDDSPKSNESSSFLPYFSKDLALAFEHTPELNATRPDDTKYLYKHNKYGNNFQNAFQTLFDVDIPVWSTSQFMNGRVKINRQNIDASWSNLRNELVEAALGGISGHWSWSSPICGDTENFDPETQTSLCVKWYMASTYLPSIKIHSSTIPRHPLAFTGTNQNLMISALKKRLSLLPYFYTTLQSAPLLRPMFYQFPYSEHLKDLNTQFSVGDDLVIVPNLMPSQTHVHFWIPPGTWYELWGGLKVEGQEGGVETLTTTEADFVTFIRGGTILVMQKDVKATAEATRLQSDFSLILALDCDIANQTESRNTDTDCLAEGKLFITNKISLDFRANNEQLSINTDGDDFGPMCEEDKAILSHIIKDVTVYGLDDGNNNYDNYRRVTVDADLCKLKEMDEGGLVITFLESSSLS